MIPDIKQLSGTINNVYTTAYTQGLEHAINVILTYAERDKTFPPGLALAIIASIENLKAK